MPTNPDPKAKGEGAQAKAAEPKAKKDTRSPELKRVEAEMAAVELPDKAQDPDGYTTQYLRLLKLAEERDALKEGAEAEANPRTLADVVAEMKVISKTLPELKKNDPEKYTAQYTRLLQLAKERDELQAQQQ